MVTTVNNSNTVAFPAPRSAATRKRFIKADQHTGIKLQLSNLLQTTLELPQVLQLFFEEVNHNIPLESLAYRSEKIAENFEYGKPSRHSCHYKLVTSQDTLGELSFSRSKRFTEKELQLLELLIGCLICPIRNALMYREAIQSALRDPLTGSGNRLALENTLDREISLARRHKHPLSMLVIDIDKFKAINDNYGHTAGDCVLKDVAKQLAQCCRDTDATYRAYRFGGEEFVILLNNTDTQGALIVAERIRTCVEAMTTCYDHQSIKVTVSVGAASLASDDTMSSLFKRADHALYQAKDNGRNQVVKAQ
jgi:diguanylate cyclase (GGDEF)-like protein